MRTKLAAVLAGLTLLAATALAQDPLVLEEIRAMHSLPKGYKIAAAAPTLKDLARQSKATFSFTYGDGQTMLFWESKDAQGRQQFTLATARLYAPRLQAARWVTLSTDQVAPSDAYDVLPKKTITVLSAKDVAAAERKRSYARVIASDSDHGTLYEIRYLSSATPHVQEIIVLAVRDTKNQWRYAGFFYGSSETPSAKYGRRVRTEARFTTSKKSPVEFTLTSFDPYSKRQEMAEDKYSGSLPFSSPKSSRSYLIVKPGDTFSELITGYLQCDLKNKGDRAFYRGMTKDILKLNPGLDPAQIKAGQQIVVPESESCEQGC